MSSGGFAICSDTPKLICSRMKLYLRMRWDSIASSLITMVSGWVNITQSLLTIQAFTLFTNLFTMSGNESGTLGEFNLRYSLLMINFHSNIVIWPLLKFHLQSHVHGRVPTFETCAVPSRLHSPWSDGATTADMWTVYSHKFLRTLSRRTWQARGVHSRRRTVLSISAEYDQRLHDTFL